VINTRNKKLVEILEDGFMKTEDNLKELNNQHPDLTDLSGCTGSVLLVIEDYLVIANCGDSPIIIFRQDEDGKLKAE